VQNCYYLPIEWRKLGIAITRIQAFSDENSVIQSLINSLSNYIVHLPADETFQTYSIHDFVNDIETCLSSPTVLSLLSYLFKAEEFYNLTEAKDVRSSGIQKEISAALQGNRSQQLNYSVLTDPDSGFLHPDTAFGREGLRHWNHSAQRMIHSIREQGHEGFQCTHVLRNRHIGILRYYLARLVQE